MLWSTGGENTHKKLGIPGIFLRNRRPPHNWNLSVKGRSFTCFKVPSYSLPVVHVYVSFALILSNKWALMKLLDSGFRVPDIKDLETLLPILVIKTSKRTSAAIVFCLCWTLCSQLNSTEVWLFSPRKEMIICQNSSWFYQKKKVLKV